MSLFAPDCARCGHDAAAYVTDDTAGAWLCRGHLKRYQLQAWSIGKTLGAYLFGETG